MTQTDGHPRRTVPAPSAVRKPQGARPPVKPPLRSARRRLDRLRTSYGIPGVLDRLGRLRGFRVHWEQWSS